MYRFIAVYLTLNTVIHSDAKEIVFWQICGLVRKVKKMNKLLNHVFLFFRFQNLYIQTMTMTTNVKLSSNTTLLKVSSRKVITWDRRQHAMLLFQFTMQMILSKQTPEQARAFIGFRKRVRDMGGIQKVYEINIVHINMFSPLYSGDTTFQLSHCNSNIGVKDSQGYRLQISK